MFVNRAKINKVGKVSLEDNLCIQTLHTRQRDRSLAQWRQTCWQARICNGTQDWQR